MALCCWPQKWPCDLICSWAVVPGITLGRICKYGSLVFIFLFPSSWSCSKQALLPLCWSRTEDGLERSCRWHMMDRDPEGEGNCCYFKLWRLWGEYSPLQNNLTHPDWYRPLLPFTVRVLSSLRWTLNPVEIWLLLAFPLRPLFAGHCYRQKWRGWAFEWEFWILGLALTLHSYSLKDTSTDLLVP